MYEVCLKSNETVHTIILLKMQIANCYASPPRQSPLALMHFSIFLCHASMHSWKDFFGIARSSFVTALLIAYTSGKRVPFMTLLSFGNRKKSQGARSGEYGGCSSTAMLFFARNSRMLKALCIGALSW